MTRRGYADTEVGQIHYREAGKGEAVLLLHQTPASSIMYERCMPFFAEHYRTIAIDTPGFGMSDPLAKKPESLHPYVQAVIGVMDSLGIAKASVVGNMTGASIALLLAAKYAERVEKLVLATFVANETEKDREEILAIMHKGITPSLGAPVRLDARGDFLEDYPMPFLRARVTRDDPEQFLLLFTAYLQAAPNYGWILPPLFEIPGPYALFPKLRCPTLVVNATQARSYANTKKAQASIEGSSYVELPGTAEFIMDDPKPFADTVLPFLRAD